MKMVTTRLRITPRLILDLRDWYRQVFVSPQQLDEQLLPDVVRPTGKTRVLAESIAGDGSWPFAGLSELVTQRSDSGILSFHGRVRTAATIGSLSPTSVLISAQKRLNDTARCRLTILSEGFQPVALDAVEMQVPAANDGEAPSHITQLQVPLMPDVLYSFPTTASAPTLLSGQVTRGSKPLFGVKIKVLASPGGVVPPLSTEPVLTDAAGRFLLVLDAIDPFFPPGYIRRPLSPSVVQVDYQGVQKTVSTAIVSGSRNAMKPLEI